MQDSNSSMCDFFLYLYCTFDFGTNFNGDASGFVYMNDHVFKRFLTHMLSH